MRIRTDTYRKKIANRTITVQSIFKPETLRRTRITFMTQCVCGVCRDGVLRGRTEAYSDKDVLEHDERPDSCLVVGIIFSFFGRKSV